MTGACAQQFLLTVANGPAGAGQHIIDIVAGFVSMKSNGTAGMNGTGDDLALLAHIHF